MGGVAVVIDWDREMAPTSTAEMLDLIPHRSQGGVATAALGHASLAETHARSTGDGTPAITSIRHVAIVGDLRLWNRDQLRSMAGGNTATQGMTDRRLILEAYLRSGIDCLDAIDGDFAFVIWDDREQRAVAVRDRFGVKPLFLQAATIGIRFASEPKQLLVASRSPAKPDPYTVSEYLVEQFRETRRTFYTGVERVPPATAVIVDRSGRRDVEYWRVEPEPCEPRKPADIVHGFRDRLVDAVHRRVASADRVVGHLSGGLDSSSVAAAAELAINQGGLDADRFHTASAVFPGSTIDESRWIDEIVASQPFPHHAFTPRIEDLATYRTDMWTTDQPRVDRIRGMWFDTVRIARRIDADLVVTGIGGDELLGYYLLFADRLRFGSPAERWRALTGHAAWRDTAVRSALVPALRTALPEAVKAPLRRLRRRPTESRGLLSEEAWRWYQHTAPDEVTTDFGFPSDTQNLTVAATRHPLVVWSNEMQEAEYASRGIDLSHPYLDKELVEYVASVGVRDRPFDGRTKILMRDGFGDRLPESVTSRRDKTYADDYLDSLFSQHLDEIRDHLRRTLGASRRLPGCCPLSKGARRRRPRGHRP